VAFKEVEVKMIHPSTAMMDFTEVFADGKMLHQLVRKYWNRVIIGVDILTPAVAEQASYLLYNTLLKWVFILKCRSHCRFLQECYTCSLRMNWELCLK
jgi:hypothetical protein